MSAIRGARPARGLWIALALASLMAPWPRMAADVALTRCLFLAAVEGVFFTGFLLVVTDGL